MDCMKLFIKVEIALKTIVCIHAELCVGILVGMQLNVLPAAPALLGQLFGWFI